MPVFRIKVAATMPVIGYLEIEAPNEDMAWEKACNNPLANIDWEPDGEPDTSMAEIIECEKVEDW